MSEDIPNGYKLQHGIAWGSRKPGVLEIKFHTPKKRNVISGQAQMLLARLVEHAQNDTSIKVIFFHGGTFYTAGNDLSVFLESSGLSEDEMRLKSSEGLEFAMCSNLIQVKNSKKPIVALIRGKCVGIGFTTTSHFDFIYCDPNASFMAPFMASAQSPEGGSTYTFVQ